LASVWAIYYDGCFKWTVINFCPDFSLFKANKTQNPPAVGVIVRLQRWVEISLYAALKEQAATYF